MAGRFTVESVFKAVDRVTAPVTRMQNRVQKFTRTLNRGLVKVNKSLNTFIGTLKRGTITAFKFGTIGIAAITAGVVSLAKQFSKIEDAEAAFTPLLGGAKKAKEMVKALNETAATTPFQFEQLSKSVNFLLPVMNGNIQDTIKTVRMLGDTAGGNAQKLESITRGFTKAMLKGKVDMESLNMIAEAGVPIFTELADSMGVEVNQAFFKMISAGKVATTDLTKAFEKMTNEGGIFFEGMEIASKTQSGLWSTLKDVIGLTAAEIGSVLAPTIKDLIRQLIDVSLRVRQWVKDNKELLNLRLQEFIEGVKTVVKALGTAFDFISRHSETITVLVAGIVALSLVTKTLIGVMTIFNLVAALNPLGLIVIAVAALIAGFAVLVTWIDDIAAGFERLPGIVRFLLTPLELVIKAIKFIKDNIGGISSAVSSIGGFFGFGGDEEQQQQASVDTQVVSPQERTARTIEEQRNTSQAEITLRTEAGTEAEVTSGNLGGNLKMQPSGSF